MSDFEYIEKIICETQSNLEFIKNNWTDSLGNQYVGWLENVLQEIKKTKKRREIDMLKLQRISLIYDDIYYNDGDGPKTKKRR